jgi:phage baseplate assembly protein W
MGMQMTIPFTVLENGAVSVETDNSVQVAQRVNAIVSTEIGERAMRATFGLPLSRLLFSANDNLISAEISSLVTQQLNAYEPGLIVQSVVPVTDQSNDGVVSISVNYSPVFAAAAAVSVANVITIEVGGTVVNVPTIGSGS